MFEDIIEAYNEWWTDKGNEGKPQTIMERLFNYDLYEVYLSTDKGNDKWLSPIG